jgi:biofilm PGA synthesis N-glycosyltransferase PgaC
MNRVAVGIMVHNEVHSLERLLTRVCAEAIPGWRLDPIVIVSSGSTDGSDEIVGAVAATDPRVRLITEPERTGKARAINRFLSALPPRVDRCILLSGDVLPERGALAHLLAPLSRSGVGMTGGVVVPTNPKRGVVNRVVHVLWALHHEVASRRPKLGEMVAFRTGFGAIDGESPVDEASIEAAVERLGLDLVYVPGARVFNRGPASLVELIAQRRRIWTGHLWLRRTTEYAVSTYYFRGLVRPVMALLWRHPSWAPYLVLAGLIELWSRLLGTMDRVRGQRLPTIWRVLPSAKLRIGS